MEMAQQQHSTLGRRMWTDSAVEFPLNTTLEYTVKKRHVSPLVLSAAGEHTHIYLDTSAEKIQTSTVLVLSFSAITHRPRSPDPAWAAGSPRPAGRRREAG